VGLVQLPEDSVQLKVPQRVLAVEALSFHHCMSEHQPLVRQSVITIIIIIIIITLRQCRHWMWKFLGA
jgi:hypothetical protein